MNNIMHMQNDAFNIQIESMLTVDVIASTANSYSQNKYSGCFRS